MKRVLATIVIILVIAIVGVFVAAAQPKQQTVIVNYDNYDWYEVGPGDTLWSIVRSEYGDVVDAREVIFYIEKENGMKDATIYPGQLIAIPKKIVK